MKYKLIYTKIDLIKYKNVIYDVGEGGGYKTSLRSEAFVNWYVRSLFGYMFVTVAVFLFQGERKFKNIDHTKIYTPLGCNIRPRIGRKYIMMGKENNKITTFI